MAATSWKDKRVLVCGGAGFIGSAFVRRLAGQGAILTVLDPCVPRTGGAARHLAGLPAIHWIRESATQFPDLKNVVREQDGIIDAMGFTSHHEGLKDPVFDSECNYLSHLSLVRALESRAIPVLYIGSRSQYGKLTGVVDENYPQAPLDAQGIHKAAAESLFRIYSPRFGYRCASLRLGNCYGPGQPVAGPDIGLIGGFIRTLLDGGTVELYGDSDRRRNIVYVDDVVTNGMRLFSSIPPGYQAYNHVGPSVPLAAILKTLIEITGRGGYALKPFDAETAKLDPGSGEISENLLEGFVGELAHTPLREAMAATVQYFREN